LVSESLQVSLPPEAGPILAGPSGRRERRALRAFVTDRRDRGGMTLSTIGAIKGVRAKTAYIRGLLFPDKAFLAARQGGRVSYLSRWKVPVHWIRRGIARWSRRRYPIRRP